MRLLVTGLFVRATRSSRQAVLIPQRGLSTPRFPAARKASTLAAVKEDEPVPDRLPQGKEIEADSRVNAEPTARGPDEVFSSFMQQIKERNEPNKIFSQSAVLISSQVYLLDKISNLSPSILNLVDRRLYDTPNHPIYITRKLIESVFSAPTFKNHVVANPVATTKDNFDALGFPADHPGRSRTDTYYVDSNHVLRTHTSAHQLWAFQRMATSPEQGYTICADVFRRDSIDRSHFPVFHQMEAARMWKREPCNERKDTQYTMHLKRTRQIEKDIQQLPHHDLVIVEDTPPFNKRTNPVQPEHESEDVTLMALHLKRSLEILVARVFQAAKEAGVGSGEGQVDEKLKVRWVEAYFPFTSPSWELEVFWQGEWLELLGCGIVKQRILKNAGLKDRIGWAWGLGIERLAMVLFGIPDIRLFWSEDPRFLSQFESGKIRKYEPFSKYPACYKDVAFWIDAAPAAASPVAAEPNTGVAAAAGGDSRKASPAETHPAAFHENDVMEIVRDVAGSLAEDVKLVDEFVHPTSGRKSLCYRINYRSLERTLTNEEVNKMHEQVVLRMTANLGIELR